MKLGGYDTKKNFKHEHDGKTFSENNFFSFKLWNMSKAIYPKFFLFLFAFMLLKIIYGAGNAESKNHDINNT